MKTERWARRRFFYLLWLVLCFGVIVNPATAQPYPVKPVRILTGFVGGSELVARVLAAQLSPALGQQVLVETRLGAGGNIAFDAVAKSAPDGYTLLMGAVPLLTNPFVYPKLAFDPMRDFVSIMMITTIPNGLFLHPSVPAKTLGEMIALARTSPGKIVYGSGGVGSANHLAAELLQSYTGIKLTHVPYKSAGFGMLGAMSGEVDMVIIVVPSGAPYVNDGRMRGLAVFDTKRSPLLPQMPTSAEAGMPRLQAVNWYALMAPAATPRAIVERLYAESAKGMTPSDVQARLRALGGEPGSMTQEQTAEFVRAEYARWGKVIREAKIRPEN